MDLRTQRVIESRDVIFREDVLPLIATTTAAAAARKKTPADIGHPNGPDTSCMPDEVAELSETRVNLVFLVLLGCLGCYEGLL